jgi:hypothetical protein
MKHTLTFLDEPRKSLLTHATVASRYELYPCLESCNTAGHIHTGSTVFIYATCSCGWRVFVGDHIDSRGSLEGRLLHLQHQIDEIMLIRKESG